MSDAGQRPARIGVRELRQNLSVYLDRVKDGERLVVTEHGQPVAELTPLASGSMSTLERLVAEGRARPAKGNLADLGSPLVVERPRGVRTASEELLALREEEPW
jgi:prevent-host-death family protein